ncbi:MAG: energy transducer TonB [Pseudomonadota bacterium]
MRLLSSFGLAAMISIALLIMMQQMIDYEAATLNEPQPTLFTSYNEPEKESDVIVIKPIKRLPKQQPEKIILDDPAPIDIVIDKSGTQGHVFDPNRFNETSDILNPLSRQLVLALGYPAQYPSLALRRGIEGYVVVEFSVDPTGSVFNARITESVPEGIFDKAALKAMAKFKYQPSVIDGQARTSHGQRYLFRFTLDE